MKRILTFLVILAATCTKAQVSVYHPMPAGNAKWCLTLMGGTSCTWTYNYTEYLNGDTTIGLKTYHKLYASGYSYCSGISPLSYFYNQFKGAYREDVATKKLYVLKNNNPNYEDLIFDFSLQAGDTLQVGNATYAGPKVAITSIDSILIGSTYRKRFWTDQAFSSTPGGNGDPFISVIEGIGSTEGMLCEFLCQGAGSGSALNAFMQNNNIDYSKNGANCDFGVGIEQLRHLVAVGPNPTSGRVTVSCPQPAEEMRVLDMLGNEVKREKADRSIVTADLSDLENGVYFLEVKIDGLRVSQKVILTR